MDTVLWAPVDGYQLGKILQDPSTPPNRVKVLVGEKEYTFPEAQTIPFLPGSDAVVDDLISLNTLNEPVILNNLRKRYEKDIIYTQIGQMLVAVNPFKILKQTYNEELLHKYQTASSHTQLPPHIYAFTKETLQDLLHSGKSQSIIISGESGAGKTESTKYILGCLATFSSNPGANKDLAAAIVAVNPILEAFGNAKTIRNNNSSRFGKLIRIYYEGANITGATIDNYLLESVRVVKQAANERNFHIFYILLKGLPAAECEELFLTGGAGEYNYLCQGEVKCGIDDKKMYNELMEAFEVLGFEESQTSEIFKIIALVLHLGNIEFSGDEKVEIANEAVLKICCTLIGCEESQMRSALTSRMFSGGGRKTSYTVPLTREQAVENRNSIAKLFFSRLFEHLVKAINEHLAEFNPDFNPNSTRFISVLDIYGFENFGHNSMEQLCINYTNEKIHNLFIDYMFKSEQQEYNDQKIPWQHITFEDNDGCIKLIEATNQSIIGMINEEVRLPKGTDKAIVEKLTAAHKQHKYLKLDPRSHNTFEVKHYAGGVIYDVTGFLDKNRNARNTAALQIVYSSRLKYLHSVFEDEIGAEKKSHGNKQDTPASKTTVLQDFRRDLTALFAVLSSSTHHYIRCIKPNMKLAPDYFDGLKVLEQLQSNGILDTIRLRKAGYEQKMLYTEMAGHYRILGINSVSDIKAVCDQLSVPEGSYAKGVTKLFLTSVAFKILEDTRRKKISTIILSTQAQIRSYNARNLLAEMIERRRKAVLKLQSFFRRARAMQVLAKLKAEHEKRISKSVIAIQSAVRRRAALIKMNDIKQQVLKEKKEREEAEKRKNETERETKLRLEREKKEEEERRLEEERQEEERKKKAASAAAPVNKLVQRTKQPNKMDRLSSILVNMAYEQEDVSRSSKEEQALRKKEIERKRRETEELMDEISPQEKQVVGLIQKNNFLLNEGLINQQQYATFKTMIISAFMAEKDMSEFDFGAVASIMQPDTTPVSKERVAELYNENTALLERGFIGKAEFERNRQKIVSAFVNGEPAPSLGGANGFATNRIYSGLGVQKAQSARSSGSLASPSRPSGVSSSRSVTSIRRTQTVDSVKKRAPEADGTVKRASSRTPEGTTPAKSRRETTGATGRPSTRDKKTSSDPSTPSSGRVSALDLNTISSDERPVSKSQSARPSTSGTSKPGWLSNKDKEPQPDGASPRSESPHKTISLSPKSRTVSGTSRSSRSTKSINTAPPEEI